MKILNRILSPIDTLRKLGWLFAHLKPVYKCWCIKCAVLKMEGDDKDTFREEIEFIRREGIWGIPFPYPHIRSGTSSCVVRHDDAWDLPYVETENGRLYFPEKQAEDSVASMYLAYVNDEGITGNGTKSKSPHSYIMPGFGIDQGDVLLDVGSAEALFTLHNIRKVSRAYVFEGKPEWERPLMATFAPWDDKANVISKYVSQKTEGDSIRLEDAIQEDESATYFVKMDIEGAEREVLSASKSFFMNHRVKLSCCVYHRHDDAAVISKMLQEMGFRVSYSDGYMLVWMGGVKYPYFRHGVIHAVNY